MLCFTSNHSFCLLFFTFFLILCYTSGIFSPFQPLSVPDGVEIVGEKQHDEVLQWKTGRSMAEDAQGNTTLVLAKERTRRKDLFHHSKPYTGGWNMSNDHYITSVISTAVPFFGVAVAWFVIFGLYLLLLCLSYCCCPGNRYGYFKLAYALSLIFIILSTIATIAGCIFLYISQGNFNGSISNTFDYVLSQAEYTAENLRNVTNYLDSAKQIGPIVLHLPQDVGKEIDNIKTEISTAAAALSNKTKDNSKILHQGVDGMGLALNIVASVMLFVVLLGFLSSIIGLPYVVYFLVIVGWILVAGTFILSGAFLFLHNVIGDTCVAMNEWVLNPTAHTALDEILPCVDNATALEVVSQSRNVTYHVVDLIDEYILNVVNGNSAPHNESGPLMPLLCNPINTDNTVRQCAAGEVALEHAAEVWKNYICETSSFGNCTTHGRMTPLIYREMTSAVNVTYGLIHYAPFLADLVDCKFVRETFTDIGNNQCPALRRYTKWIYFGLAMVSVPANLSLIFWIIYQRELTHRRDDNNNHNQS